MRDVRERWQSWWMVLLVAVPIVLGIWLIISRVRVWTGM